MVVELDNRHYNLGEGGREDREKGRREEEEEEEGEEERERVWKGGGEEKGT